VVRRVQALVHDSGAGGGLRRELGVRRIPGDDLDAVGDLRVAGSVHGPDRNPHAGELFDEGEPDGAGTEHDMDTGHGDLLSGVRQWVSRRRGAAQAATPRSGVTGRTRCRR
jgi:hypothetical protein